MSEESNGPDPASVSGGDASVASAASEVGTPAEAATPPACAAPSVEVPAPAVPANGKPAGSGEATPPPSAPTAPPVAGPVAVEWRSWLGWFALLWLLDLGGMAWYSRTGFDPALAAASKAVLFHYLEWVGAGLVLAGILTFALPLSLLDESSRTSRRWWLAWAWPPVLLGMLAVDLLAAGLVLLPVLKALKPD